VTEAFPWNEARIQLDYRMRPPLLCEINLMKQSDHGPLGN